MARSTADYATGRKAGPLTRLRQPRVLLAVLVIAAAASTGFVLPRAWNRSVLLADQRAMLDYRPTQEVIDLTFDVPEDDGRPAWLPGRPLTPLARLTGDGRAAAVGRVGQTLVVVRAEPTDSPMGHLLRVEARSFEPATWRTPLRETDVALTFVPLTPGRWRVTRAAADHASTGGPLTFHLDRVLPDGHARSTGAADLGPGGRLRLQPPRVD